MKYSSLTARIGGDGAAAWNLHYRAMEAKQAGEPIIVLSVGDPDFDTPRPVVDAAIASIRDGHTHYSDYRGERSLRAAIAARHRAETGQHVEPDQVVVQAGAQCALFSTALCILENGDEVIVPEPMYVTYEGFLGAAGASIVNIPLRPDDHFRLNADALAAAVTSRTRAVLVNTPNNPTGAVVDRSTWEQVAATCCEHDLWLIIDQVYASLIYEGEHFNPAILPGMAERTATVSSVSKSHAMTGWRLGWVIGPPDLAHHVSNLTLCMLYGSPTFIQHAAELALSTDMPEVETMRQAYRQRRDSFCALLDEVPTLHCHIPQGGMFVMVDVRETGLSAAEFAEQLYVKYSVSVLAGEAFGPSAAGHVRCNLGVSERDLLEAAHRIAACARDFTGD